MLRKGFQKSENFQKLTGMHLLGIFGDFYQLHLPGHIHE